MYSLPDFSSARVERSSSDPIGDLASTVLPTVTAPIDSTVSCFLLLTSPTTVGSVAPPIFESLDDNPFHLPNTPLPVPLFPPVPTPLARKFLLFDVSRRKNRNPIMAITRTIPPTTPPAMAPAVLLLESVLAPTGIAVPVVVVEEDREDVEEILAGAVVELTAPRQERSVPL